MVKQEMTVASQTLLGPQWVEPILPEAPNLEEQFGELHSVMKEEGRVVDLTDDMEAEEIEESESQGVIPKLGAKALRPFRGAGSPTKVASHHLKPKSQDVKDAKIKERDKEEK